VRTGGGHRRLERSGPSASRLRRPGRLRRHWGADEGSGVTTRGRRRRSKRSRETRCRACRARNGRRHGAGRARAPSDAHGLPRPRRAGHGRLALAGFSEGLAAEVRSSGIAVTTVYPGLMRTGSPRNALFKGQHRAEYAWFSIADAIPGLSMEVTRAARRIASACARGDPSLVLTLPARVAVTLHAAFPRTTIRLLGLVNRLLPGADGGGPHAARGRDSEAAWSPSILTRPADQAVRARTRLDRTHRSRASLGGIPVALSPLSSAGVRSGAGTTDHSICSEQRLCAQTPRRVPPWLLGGARARRVRREADAVTP
jgi:hypothetical protein